MNPEHLFGTPYPLVPFGTFSHPLARKCFVKSIGLVVARGRVRMFKPVACIPSFDTWGGISESYRFEKGICWPGSVIIKICTSQCIFEIFERLFHFDVSSVSHQHILDAIVQ